MSDGRAAHKAARPTNSPEGIVRDYIVTNASGVEMQIQLEDDEVKNWPGAKPVETKAAKAPANKQAAPTRNKAARR